MHDKNPDLSFLHVFGSLCYTTNVKGNGPDWLFDVDSLSISMNYVPVAVRNKTNGIAGTKDNIVAGQAQKEKEPKQDYILIPLCTTDPLISQGPKDCEGDAGMKPIEVDENEASDKSGKHDQEVRSESERLNKKEMQTEHANSSNGINTVSTPVSTAGPSFDTAVPSTPVNTAQPSVSTANESEEQLFERFSPFKNAFTLPPVPNISSMDNTSIFRIAYDDEDVKEEVDMNNVISSYSVPDTSFTRFHKDHPEDQSCGKGAHIGDNCPSKALIISNPEPCNQTIDELSQTLSSFDPMCYSEKENSLPYVSKPNFVDDSPNVFNPPPQPPMYSCEFCGNDARYGHYCTPQVPFIYPETVLQSRLNFRYLYYHEQNSCYDPNSFSFDQFQPPQYTVNHPILNAQNDLLNSQNKLLEQITSVCDMVGQYIQKKEEEQAAKARYWKIPICYDDDDDEESSTPLKDIIMSELPPCVVIIPDSPKTDSLIMEDEHLSTISETELDNSKGLSHLVSFSNPLFDINDDCTSSDDESFSEEDVPMENFKFFSNPLFDLDEEIVSTKVNLIQNEVLESITSIPLGINSFDVESNLIESLLNRNTSIDSSSKIDSLLDEFVGELTLLKSIPHGIDDDNLDPEGEIHLVERLLYDNSSPRSSEDSNSDVSDAITESFSPSPIPVKDSDSLMEEIDLFLTLDDSMPPGIETDDYDSEGDIFFFEELLTDDPFSTPLSDESFPIGK
ncbi:hypothetical protein Tco_0728101 [Tanacetum coccineum]|uniref:Uncharacterized protein n=1 Tax=Tanacetum coccineum TaxID=301880 RepID=A0ABQ4YMJ5_9ASTR